MLNNIPVINFFIFAAGVGIVIAMIYTNIQRSALSAFFNALIDKGCTDEKTALTMKELGLYGIKASIASSGAKKLFGLKKTVSIVLPDDAAANDTLENVLEGKHDEKYYLADSCDTELILKKYNYKPLSVKKMILLCSATLIIVIVAAFFTDMILEHVFTKKLEKKETVSEEQQQDENSEKDKEESEEGKEDTDKTTDKSDKSENGDEDTSKDTSEEQNDSDLPQIPM